MTIDLSQMWITWSNFSTVNKPAGRWLTRSWKKRSVQSRAQSLACISLGIKRLPKLQTQQAHSTLISISLVCSKFVLLSLMLAQHWHRSWFFFLSNARTADNHLRIDANSFLDYRTREQKTILEMFTAYAMGLLWAKGLFPPTTSGLVLHSSVTCRK